MSVPFDRIAVTSITQVAGLATATIVSTANLITGNLVLIEGANEAPYNGQKSIKVVNATTFTYAIDATAAASATGTMYYRASSTPYMPFFGKPIEPEVVSYHSAALEDSVVVVAEGRTVTSLYGYLSGTSPTDDLYLYVFDSTTIPANGNLVTQTALPGLEWQMIKCFAGFNFYIDVPTDGTRFYKGVTLVLATNGDPTTYVAATTNPAHYDLEFHS